MATKAIRIQGKFPALKMVSRELLLRALPRIVELVADQARLEAPKDRGTASKKSIVSRISGRIERKAERGIVDARAPHSHLIEFGVTPHTLAGGASNRGKPRRRKKGAVLKIYGTGEVLRRSAWHPGLQADPFLERAIPASQGRVDAILAQEGNRAFEDAVAGAKDIIDELF